jgi:hypothetical protein
MTDTMTFCHSLASQCLMVGWFYVGFWSRGRGGGSGPVSSERASATTILSLSVLGSAASSSCTDGVGR